MRELLYVYIDGACRGNPGPAGMGAVFYDEKKKPIFEMSRYLGRATNNIAEYQALVLALKKARELACKKLYVYTDSELLSRQINGIYRVKDKKLKALHQEAKELLKDFSLARVIHTGRTNNDYADKLARQAVRHL